MIRPKQFARLGEFHLEEAILDVLLEAKYEDNCIGAADISRRAGIFRDRGIENIMNDAIATGLLVKLRDQGNAILEKMDYNAVREDHKPENRRKPGGKKF